MSSVRQIGQSSPSTKADLPESLSTTTSTSRQAPGLFWVSRDSKLQKTREKLWELLQELPSMQLTCLPLVDLWWMSFLLITRATGRLRLSSLPKLQSNLRKKQETYFSKRSPSIAKFLSLIRRTTWSLTKVPTRIWSKFHQWMKFLDTLFLPRWDRCSLKSKLRSRTRLTSSSSNLKRLISRRDNSLDSISCPRVSTTWHQALRFLRATWRKLKSSSKKELFQISPVSCRDCKVSVKTAIWWSRSLRLCSKRKKRPMKKCVQLTEPNGMFCPQMVWINPWSRTCKYTEQRLCKHNSKTRCQIRDSMILRESLISWARPHKS